MGINATSGTKSKTKRPSLLPEKTVFERARELAFTPSLMLRALLNEEERVCSFLELRGGGYDWVVIPRERIEVLAFNNVDVLYAGPIFVGPTDLPNRLHLFGKMCTLGGGKVEVQGKIISTYRDLWIVPRRSKKPRQYLPPIDKDARNDLVSKALGMKWEQITFVFLADFSVDGYLGVKVGENRSKPLHISQLGLANRSTRKLNRLGTTLLKFAEIPAGSFLRANDATDEKTISDLRILLKHLFNLSDEPFHPKLEHGGYKPKFRVIHSVSDTSDLDRELRRDYPNWNLPK